MAVSAREIEKGAESAAALIPALPELAPARRYFPYLALLLVLALFTAMLKQTRGFNETIPVFLCLPVVASVYFSVVRYFRNRSSRLYLKNLGASRANPLRYQVLKRTLDGFIGNDSADVIICPDPSVAASCHWQGERYFVAINLGFLKRYSDGLDWAAGEPTPETKAMLAHEAGHIAAGDPRTLPSMLAAFASAIAICALSFALSFFLGWGFSANLKLSALQIPAMILIWTVFVIASEIEADHFEIGKIGRQLAAAFLEHQRSGVSKFFGVTGFASRIVRSFLQPPLEARAALDFENSIRVRQEVFIALGLGSFITSSTLSARLLFGGGILPAILQAIFLVGAFLIIQYPFFFFRSLRFPPVNLKGSVFSFLRSILFAFPYIALAYLGTMFAGVLGGWQDQTGLMMICAIFFGYLWAVAQVAVAYRELSRNQSLVYLVSSGLAALSVGGFLYLTDWAGYRLYSGFLVWAASHEFIHANDVPSGLLLFVRAGLVFCAIAACGISAQAYRRLLIGKRVSND